MLSFDFQQLSAREKYKILIGSVVPRPIALVTTIDAEGRANAALSKVVLPTPTLPSSNTCRRPACPHRQRP